ncbi:MAG: hypothetical protein Q4C83_02875, partial [Candidatus Saccharibacteria bacterium]|nr:hypothetical protein [Candidatus Saccharibacteria bacterium]
CVAQMGTRSSQLVEVEDCTRDQAILYLRAQRLTTGYQVANELLAMVFRELLNDALNDHDCQLSVNYSAGALQIAVEKRCEWINSQSCAMVHDLKHIDYIVDTLIEEIEERKTASDENYRDRFEKAKARVVEKIIAAGGIMEYRRRHRAEHNWCLDWYDAEAWPSSPSYGYGYGYARDMAMLNYAHLVKFAKMFDRSLCVVRVVNALNKSNAGVYRGHLSDIPVRVSDGSVETLCGGN